MAKTKFEVTAFTDYFRTKRFEFTYHDRAATEDFRRSWRCIFSTPCHQPKGLETPDWEVFAAGYTAYLAGDDAIAILQAHRRGDYYIWLQLERVGALEFRNQPIPPFEVLEQAHLAHWRTCRPHIVFGSI